MNRSSPSIRRGLAWVIAVMVSVVIITLLRANVPTKRIDVLTVDRAIDRALAFLAEENHFRNIELVYGSTNPVELWLAREVGQARQNQQLLEVVGETSQLLRREPDWHWIQPLPGEALS